MESFHRTSWAAWGLREGRKERPGKLDSTQQPPSGMLLFLLPDQGRQDAGHWLPAAPCEPLCPRWARHAAVSTTSPDPRERSTGLDRTALCRGPSAMATVCGGAHHLWELRSTVHNRILRKICRFHLSSHKRQYKRCGAFRIGCPDYWFNFEMQFQVSTFYCGDEDTTKQ